MYRLAAASLTEPTVFGAARPGYRDLGKAEALRDRKVGYWIEFMKEQNIDRVCCLLTPKQISQYSNLLDTYKQRFAREQVCWTPIKDFHFVERATLIDKILPFLMTTEKENKRVVVHCSGGIGRTGQILAAWLVARRELSITEAISVVRASGRNPDEARFFAILKGRNPTIDAKAFDTLLDEARQIVKAKFS
jgi:protein-tyrosine phosphatase